MGVVTGAVSFDRGGDAAAAGHLLAKCSDEVAALKPVGVRG